MGWLGKALGAASGFGLLGVGVGHAADKASETDELRYRSPELDPEGKKVIDAFHNDSQATEQDLVNRELAGADASQGMLDSSAAPSSLGGDPDPGMGEALARRSQKLFNRGAEGARASAELKAPEERFNRAKQSLEIAAAQTQIQNDIYKRQYQNMLNVQAAKNAVIRGILGAVGTGVGFALGGPAGAAAGGAVAGAGANAVAPGQMQPLPGNGDASGGNVGYG